MKHAYLILAHTDLLMLQLLVCMLDDVRNDIYIHIDRKAPFDGKTLQTQKSNLFVLEERMDCRWGDFSLVEAEFLLFGKAFEKGLYSYYHLLSGVDMPIKSQDYIHAYCEKYNGTEFIGFAQNVTLQELKWRSQHYFLFSKDFQTRKIWKRALRALFIYLQDFFLYKRSSWVIKKGSQWCSVTSEFVKLLLSCQNQFRAGFSHTYCPDELVLQTLCWNSDFRERVCSLSDEFYGCKRYIKWEDGVLLPILENDINDMFYSDRWFARKFSSSDIVVEQLIEKWKTNNIVL